LFFPELSYFIISFVNICYKVFIFNLFIENTVEEVIYSRLDKRLEDARNTLGPVAEVLGKIEDEIPELMLIGKMDAEERNKYLYKLELNLDKAKRDEKKNESQNLNLYGLGQKYLNKKWGVLNYIVDLEEKVAEYVVLTENNYFTLLRGADDCRLKVLGNNKKNLLDMLHSYLIKKDQKKKYEHLKKNITLPSFDVVLNHDAAMEKGGEYLNVNHPIVKVLIKKNSKRLQGNAIYQIETDCSEISTGYYFIIEYKCQINIGSRKQNSCFYQTGFNQCGDNFEVISDQNLLKNLYDFSFWKSSGGGNLNEKEIEKAETIARDMAKNFFDEQLQKIKNKIQNELQLKKDALEKMVTKEKDHLKEKIDSTPDPQKKARYSELLTNLVQRLDVDLNDIAGEEDISFSPVVHFCSEIIRR